MYNVHQSAAQKKQRSRGLGDSNRKKKLNALIDNKKIVIKEVNYIAHLIFSPAKATRKILCNFKAFTPL